MATNIFVPIFTGDLAGELGYTMANYAVPIALKKSIESVAVTYQNAVEVKMTGFEGIRHVIAPTTGDDILCTVDIQFAGDLAYSDRRRLETLANGMLGAGLSMYFYDDWIDSVAYTCRWLNAGDFVSNTELLAGGMMHLEAWKVVAL